MNNLAVLEITDTGLAGLEAVEEAVFFEYGEKLAHAEKGLQWAIGDWYNNIPWGDKQKACDRVGLKYNSAKEYGRTSASYQMSTRVDILPFSTHRILIHEQLKASDRTRLLKRAAKEGWAGSRVKKERDLILEIAPPAPTAGFDDGVDKLTREVVAKLPKGTNAATVNRMKSGLKTLTDDLKHSLSSAVDTAAEAKSKVQRENLKRAKAEAKAEFKRTIEMQAGVKAFTTKAEFQLVRSVLHSDRNTHPRAGEAFAIFNRLADVKTWGKK